MGRLRADDPSENISHGTSHGGKVQHFPDDDTRLGDIMRGERATLGKSLLDVQRELRIRASYVAAIENCDMTAFDAPSFVAGYVRSYARYLGMDSDWTFRRFCLESGFQPTHGMAPTAAGPKPAKRPSDPVEALANPKALFIPQKESFWSEIEPKAIGAFLVLIALVCGLGYGGWSILQEVQRVTLAPDDTAPGVVTALDPVDSAGLYGPETDLSGTTDLAQGLSQPEGLDRLYRPQILEAPVLTSRDGPIAAIDPGLGQLEGGVGGTTQTSQVQIGPMLPGSVQPAAMSSDIQHALAQAEALHGSQLAGGQPTTAMTVAPDAPPLELLAVRPAWVRVASADGTVLLEKIMDAGERFTLPTLEEPPVLRTGNSGAIYFAVKGQTYGPAAPGPQVVKNIKLTPNDVTENFAIADLTADPELAQMVAVAQAGPLTNTLTQTE